MQIDQTASLTTTVQLHSSVGDLLCILSLQTFPIMRCSPHTCSALPLSDESCQADLRPLCFKTPILPFSFTFLCGTVFKGQPCGFWTSTTVTSRSITRLCSTCPSPSLVRRCRPSRSTIWGKVKCHLETEQFPSTRQMQEDK